MLSKQNLFVFSVGFFISATLFSLLINTIFLKLSKNMGARTKNNEDLIRWTSDTKPALGGISFFIVFLIAFASYSIFFENKSLFQDKQILGFLGISCLAFLMGLADDAHNTKPFLKFFVQVICGVILIVSGSCIQLFDYQIINYIVTIFWVIGIMNSINMLDNMDAITTTVSIFIILAALFYIFVFNDYYSIDFLILIGVLASLIGFLFYNWHPSKLYMGDTGSQFLGILLAYIGLKYFWNSTSLDGDIDISKQLVTTLIVFILPIIDTGIVFINRISRGQSPFIGGKDHTTHNLVYSGFSDSQVALTFGGLSLVSFLFSIIILLIDEWNWWYSCFFIVYVLMMFSIFFYLTKIYKSRYAEKKE